MPGSHFFAEDEPELTARELVTFLEAVLRPPLTVWVPRTRASPRCPS
jgi:hypothetical protein